MTMEELVSLSKQRGFVFPSSDIYGGLANAWDYGPLGVEMIKKIKDAWWKFFVDSHKNIVGIDSSILMNPKVWEASGHLAGFSDPLIDCKSCKNRFRADQIIEDYYGAKGETRDVSGLSSDELYDCLIKEDIACPKCGKIDYTPIRKFNLMFKTFQGASEDSTTEIFLRPETAQGIFVNFKSVQRASRKSVPFGIGQIGKVFRNEITPGNFVFRTREFEQMELEFFCKPENHLEWYNYWKDYCMNFLLELGLKKENLRIRDHSKEELSHYSSATCDIEYKFPFGWGELWGIASRTDFDLSRHQEYSTKDLKYTDPQTNEKFIPYVIEPSVGVSRLFLALIFDSIENEELGDGSSRMLMRLNEKVAPVSIAVLPLSKKLNDKADGVFSLLSKSFSVDFDDRGSIGKRYRRNDEIGTPFCVTVDFDTLEDEAVTVRHRDTMEQERIKLDELKEYFNRKISY